MTTTPALQDRRLLDDDRLRAAMADWARQCGERVRERRKTLKWNQGQLAELAGVSFTTISKIEVAAIIPKDSLKVAIATALLCDVVDLWPHPDRGYVMSVARAVA